MTTGHRRLQVVVCTAWLTLMAIDGLAQSGAGASRLTVTQTLRGSAVAMMIEVRPQDEGAPHMTLERNGVVWDVEDVRYTPDGSPKTSASVTGRVPAAVALGAYRVTFYLGGHLFRPDERLVVQPGGDAILSLAEFSPDHTYELATKFVATKWSPSEVKLVHWKFSKSLSRNERNQISVKWDGRPLDVIWNDCPAPSTPVPGDPIAVVRVSAKVVPNDDGTGQVELCDVPADAEVFPNRDKQMLPPSQALDKRTLRGTPQGGGTAERRDVIRRLVLRGSGFQYERPDDTAVWLNGERIRVSWTGCTGLEELGTEGVPRELSITGEVTSRDQISLCGLPVPTDGHMRLAVGYGDTQSPIRLFRAFGMNWREVATISAIIALVLALLPLALLTFVGKGYDILDQPYKFRMLFLDQETDTYSLSKLQFYLWTIAGVFGYSYLFISRVTVQSGSWPDIPGTLPGIIAVAGGTAVGAQIVTSMKGSKGGGEQKPSLSDFITSGGVVATDRVQMLVWTLVGVGAFVFSVIQQGPGTITDLPALPERLLYLMGLSSTGYLAGKLARKAGPVINEISISPPESNDAISKAAKAGSTTLPDLVKPIVDAQTLLAALKPVANVNAKDAAAALSNAIKSAGAGHTTSEINNLIVQLDGFRTAAEAAAVKTAADVVGNRATRDEGESAQQAAAAVQDLASGVTQAISVAASGPMSNATAPALIARIVELRGTNLSPDALLEIDHADLPFRMLMNAAGQNAPEVVIRDETTPTLARVLRLSIDPARLATADLDAFNKWFGSDGQRTFTITNPDGQKAEAAFQLPPRKA